MKKIPFWPTLATIGNLVCGFSALAAAATANFERAAWLVVVAMLFDAADGRLARMTRTTSKFGAELDSIADIVSFGVAPAFIVYKFALYHRPGISEKFAWAASALFLICAALRLARFNVETSPDAESHRSFRGLPSPAAAGLMVTAVILLADLGIERFAVGLLPFLLIVSAGLMVTRVRYPHLISQLDVGERPFSFLVMVIFFATLITLAPQIGLFLVFAFYAASGPIGLTIDQVLERIATSESEDSLF